MYSPIIHLKVCFKSSFSLPRFFIFLLYFFEKPCIIKLAYAIFTTQENPMKNKLFFRTAAGVLAVGITAALGRRRRSADNRNSAGRLQQFR